MIEARRGAVVLVAFPFVGEDGLGRKRRPAVALKKIDRALEDALALPGPTPES